MLILRKFARDRSAVIGAGLICLLLLVALFAGQLAPYPGDAYLSHLELRLLPPSSEHLLGTDNLGRDLLSRLILGSRTALMVGAIVVGGAALIGVPAGLVAGYTRGWLSELIMRTTDVFLSVPQLVLALALAQLLGPSIQNAMLALALTYWPFFCRIVYAEARRLSNVPFIEALEALRASRLRIMLVHVLPNAISPIIMRATVGMGFAILMAATLSFLGVGAVPPEPDWGLSIAESRQYLPGAWWFAAFPGLAIFFTVLGFNLLGDGVRDIVDPRLRRSR